MSGVEQTMESELPSDSIATENQTESADSYPPQRTPQRTALEEGIRPLAIAGMLTCIAVSLAQFIATFSPEWPGRFFVILVFIVSLESIHSQRQLARLNLYPRDRLRYRFVEWVVILLAVRFGVYLRYGTERLLSDISHWTVNIGAFFDISFIINSILIVAFWALARTLSTAVSELDPSALEHMPFVTDPQHYLRATMPHQGRVDRQARLNRIVGIFLVGGVFLLVFAGLSRVDVRELVTLRHGRNSGLVLNALLYFLIGFLIISHARYTILRANWEIQNLPILDRIGRRWLFLVIFFLLLLGIISAMLPVGYSVGILETVSIVVQWIIYALLQFVFLLLFIISSIIGFLMGLFRGESTSSAPPMRRAVPPPPPSTVSAGPAPWWQVVRSLIFWTVLIGIIGYSLYHFMGYRGLFLRELRLGSLVGWLGKLWYKLRSGTCRAGVRLREEIARRLAGRSRAPARAPWRFLSLRRLSPRDRVRYYYLSVVRRSAQQGFGRPPARTPLEYEETLRRELADVAEDVHALTEAFVEARYSAHDVAPQYARVLQGVWRQVRKALTWRRRHAVATRANESGE